MSARDKAILWCFLACAAAVYLVILYCMLVVASREDDRMEEEYAKLLVPETTPVPAPEPTVWTRYAVNLDDELQKHIEKLCAEYRIPASVVMAVIETESGCDPNAMGDVEDGYYQSFGLMQIREKSHHDRCVRLGADNLFSPYQNTTVGIDYLAELIDYFDGDYEKALSFYNHDDTGEYAYKVLRMAECLMESSMMVEEAEP